MKLQKIFHTPSISDVHDEPGLPSLLRFSCKFRDLRRPALVYVVLGQRLWLAACTLGAAGLSAAEAKVTHATTRAFSVSGASLGELLHMPPVCFGAQGARLQPAASY